MGSVDYLLSDEFVKFSQEVARIHGEKKHLKEELEGLYLEYKNKIKSLEEEAKALEQAFEQWKAGQGKD